ncbi:MAG TPA: 3-dehydroquinate dehydratase [Sulfurimonas sp. UBA12504]|nr:MAG: 3-dehydroquinate dehydratase [Sulfurimonas sp. GWF2_37_8]DAB30714.1 MAG TPA: 3-dehydroquinate dehydratase [Sulfurimonas sp. UBA12504]
MKIFNRGLFALILTILFQSQLSAEYLYKDDVIHNPNFSADVEKVGSELYQKTGIALRLLMLHELPDGVNILEYQEKVLQELSGPTILLTFSELNMKVDILANDTILYEYFDKKQVLSPVASQVQAVIMAAMYGKNWEHFKYMANDYGGSILPLISGKAKPEQRLGMYSGSMFNGYIDIAEQIAVSKGVVLENAAGNANKNSILLLKVLFYGFIIYAIFMFIRIKLKRRREPSEQK